MLCINTTTKIDRNMFLRHDTGFEYVGFAGAWWRILIWRDDTTDKYANAKGHVVVKTSQGTNKENSDYYLGLLCTFISLEGLQTTLLDWEVCRQTNILWVYACSVSSISVYVSIFWIWILRFGTKAMLTETYFLMLIMKPKRPNKEHDEVVGEMENLKNLLK